MARPRSRRLAMLVLIVLGALLVAAGLAVVTVALAWPDLLSKLPLPPEVDTAALSGAAAALGVAGTVAGAAQLGAGAAAVRGSQTSMALGSALAATIAFALFVAAVAAAVSGSTAPTLGLLALAGLYAWAGVVLALP